MTLDPLEMKTAPRAIVSDVEEPLEEVPFATRWALLSGASGK
jgi:hypothetical protein